MELGIEYERCVNYNKIVEENQEKKLLCIAPQS